MMSPPSSDAVPQSWSTPPRCHLFGAQPARQQPLARLAVLERRREEVVEEQHLDAALAHQVDERVVLLPGSPHPDHVVEEQVMAVAGRQALVRDVGSVDHHGPQRPDLGVGAERRCGHGGHC
jgi:hypothetical protein